MTYSKRTAIILVTVSSILFGIIYLWLVSIGTWTQLSKTSTYYYRMQADGFLAGTPALLIEPDPRLAQLENPYPAENRQDIPVLMDAAYFKGKYYLYYGPAPAFALAGFMLLFKRQISEGYFTFISAWLIFTFSALLITRIWRNHFPTIPLWLVTLSLIITGTMYPVMWGVNSARIYEAAILTCSAFIIAGLFFSFDALDGKGSKRLSLIIAGVFWGFAVASRLISITVIAVLCSAIVIRLLWSGKRIKLSRSTIIDLFALLTPVGLTLGLLGWYNYLRFDNPLETGFKYSLIGIKGVSSFYNEGKFFNLHYFLPNLANYLFNLPEIFQSFPFVKNSQASGEIYKILMHTDAGYYRESITGLLFSMPFMIFSGVFVWFAIAQFRNKDRTGNSALIASDIDRPIDLVFSVAAIGIAGSLGFIVILTYYVVTTRFLLDFIGLLNIVAVSGMWILFIKLGNALIPRRILSVLILLIAIYSTGISFLLAITGELNRFQIHNPGLYEKIAKLFS
jgi:hypothetical protein